MNEGERGGKGSVLLFPIILQPKNYTRQLIINCQEARLHQKADPHTRWLGLSITIHRIVHGQQALPGTYAQGWNPTKKEEKDITTTTHFFR